MGLTNTFKTTQPYVRAHETDSRASSSTQMSFENGFSRTIELRPQPEYETQQLTDVRVKENKVISTVARSRSITLWWVPEIVALLLSVAALLAIAIVLRIYDGRALTDLNMPKDLTLNGIIAAIATFDRIFLTVPVGSAISQEVWLWFARNNKKTSPRSQLQDLGLSDQASRGAWGSFIFIFRSRRRLLALFGALIMVISLTIGTFSQQLIGIENLPIMAPSALQPGSVPRSTIYKGTSSDSQETNYGPPLNVLAPVYQGLFSGGVEPVQATCLSGNCTFPATTSLAMCGACAPIEYHQTSCTDNNINPMCNYTTAAGSNFSLLNNEAADLHLDGTGFQVQTSFGKRWSKSVKDTLYLANFEMMGYNYTATSGSTRGQELKATECALWFCVNTYETTISSGIQQQAQVSSFSNVNATYNLNDYTFHVPTNNIEDDKFVVDDVTYEALQSAFYGKLNGTVTSGISGYYTLDDSILAIWNGTTNQDWWISNLAMSLTNHIRTANPASDSRFDGTAYQLGVKIRWVWLALPVAMVVFAILFLTIVMVQTARSDVSSWKASPLTLLLFDVDGGIRQDALSSGWPDVVNGAEKGVGERPVVLRQGKDGGWVFRGV